MAFTCKEINKNCKGCRFLLKDNSCLLLEPSTESIIEAYKAYPLTDDYMNHPEINAKRVGFQQGYDQAIKSKSIEWSEFDNDMMNAIICLTKQGRHLEEEHINWIKNFINKLHIVQIFCLLS